MLLEHWEICSPERKWLTPAPTMTQCCPLNSLASGNRLSNPKLFVACSKVDESGGCKSSRLRGTRFVFSAALPYAFLYEPLAAFGACVFRSRSYWSYAWRSSKLRGSTRCRIIVNLKVDSRIQDKFVIGETPTVDDQRLPFSDH